MITIPNEVKTIMKKIVEQGYEIYIVGGYVRDSIINRNNKDYDLCTNMPFEEIKEILPSFSAMRENDHRNTGTLRINNIDIEISTIRGNDISDDLKGRDFTINSIAVDSEGNIIDMIGGYNDIQNKIISLSDKTGKSLEVDPLRILRAIRFVGVLGYEIDEETYNHMLDKKDLLNTVAKERILIELNKIIMCENPSELFSKYYEILSVVIPELTDIKDLSQNNPYHIYDVFEHTMKALDSSERNLDLRYAILFHDTGKKESKTTDEDGIDHFYNHPKISTEKFIKFAHRMKMNKTSIERIKKLIFFHDVTLSTKSKSMNHFLKIFGSEDIELLFDMKLCDILGQNLDKIDRAELLEKLRKMYLDYLSTSPALKIKDLSINGRDLINMNFEGKIIGIILKDVLDQVGQENIGNNPEEIRNYITSKYR